MTTVEEIEEAVANITPEKLARFRTWFEEFEAALFDRQIAKEIHDVSSTLLLNPRWLLNSADAAHGDFVSEAAVDEVFAKYRKA